MGKRGPLPKSRTLKLLTGSRRPGRVGDKPMPERGIPKMPKWLSKAAAVEFRRIAKDLDREGLLARIDGGVLAHRAQVGVEIQEAVAQIEKEGRTVTLSNGVVCDHSATKRLQRNLALALQYDRELGLTPAGRERLTAAGDDTPTGSKVLSRNRQTGRMERPDPTAEAEREAFAEEFLRSHGA